MSHLVLCETEGDLGILTLNRPERHNSLVPELLSEFLRALGRMHAPEVRAVILQANGRSFSTGGDVQAFYEHRTDAAVYASEVVGLLNEAILSLINLPVPVVAAVHGIVTGGSLGLVLASDIVLVAPEASFTPYYSTVGFSPDGGWTAMLPLLIGNKRAAEALMLDRPISAQEAVAWGMANRLVPAGELQAEARAVARAIARQAPESIRRAKQLIWRNADCIAERLDAERQQFVQQIVGPQAQQGMADFLGRRRK